MPVPRRRIPGAISIGRSAYPSTTAGGAGLDAADAPVRDAAPVEVGLDGVERSGGDRGQQPARGLRVVGQRDELRR